MNREAAFFGVAGSPGAEFVVVLFTGVASGDGAAAAPPNQPASPVFGLSSLLLLLSPVRGMSSVALGACGFLVGEGVLLRNDNGNRFGIDGCLR